MKKILISIFMIMASVLCFTACDGLGEKYWELVATDSAIVFESENFDNVYNISFGQNLSYIMAQSYGKDYAEITTVLSPMFESAVYYAYKHYNDFLIVPLNESGDFKKQIKDVYKKIDQFSSALQVFVTKKAEYESNITFTSEQTATSDLEKAMLLKFKREYITIIESAYNLSESIFEARRLGYYDFSDYSSQEDLSDASADCSLAVNASNLQITKTAIKITRAYNAKEIANKYENYWSLSQNFYQGVVKPFEEDLLTESANIKENLEAWLHAYEMFKAECQTLDEVIQKIDLKKLTNSVSAEDYATKTGNEIDRVYAEYFLNFYQKVALLSEYTASIFN